MEAPEPPEDRSLHVEGWLEALPVEGIGVVGLCFATVTALWRGWLYTGATVDRLTKMYDDRIAELTAERVELKATIATQGETIREVAGQNNELLELAQTGNALMRGLIQATGRDV